MSLRGKKLKGLEFLPEWAPSSTRDPVKWAAENTKRWKIVARDGNVEIVAEELKQRALNKLTSGARRIAGMIIRADDKTRREIVAAFDASGDLKIPFEKV